MDDPKTRAALETLADLFLTGAAPAKAAIPGRPPAPANSLATALDGPRPIRLAPKLRPPAAGAGVSGLEMPAHAPPPPRRSARPAHTGETPALRLHRHVAEATANQPAAGLAAQSDLIDDPDDRDEVAGQAVVEGVFLGNLPGFGGPWLTQYARFLATGTGPVAVLRVDANEISLELVSTPKPPPPQNMGPEDAQPPATIEGWAADAAGENNLLELLDGLANFEGTPVRHWLVHFNQSAAPAAMAMVGDLAHWTFLCGSDQAAVVGAYGLLKQLIDADAGRTQRRVGFIIMGSDEEASLATVDRLNAAAAGFLRQPLEFVGSLKQMSPVSLHIVGTFANTPTMWDELVSFFQDQAGTNDIIADEVDEEEEDQLAFPTAGRAATPAMDPRLGASLDMESLSEDFEMAEAPQAAPPLISNMPEPVEPPEPPEAPAATETQEPSLPNPKSEIRNPKFFSPAPRPTLAQTFLDDAAQEVAQTPTPSQPIQPAAQARPRYEPFPPAPPAAAATAPQSAESRESTASVAPGDAARLSEDSKPRLNGVRSPENPTDASASEPGPDLAQYVTGGVLLEARCPRHPQTRLVLDEAGVLHLLRRHGTPRSLGVRRDGGAAEVGNEALRAAVVDLIEARAWVKENLPLLRMTQRQFNFDETAEPVLHLFTDQAKLAAALVGQLGTLIKLHLLQEVHVGGTVSWYCAELN